jgi:hypothetical protein
MGSLLPLRSLMKIFSDFGHHNPANSIAKPSCVLRTWILVDRFGTPLFMVSQVYGTFTARVPSGGGSHQKSSDFSCTSRCTFFGRDYGYVGGIACNSVSSNTSYMDIWTLIRGGNALRALQGSPFSSQSTFGHLIGAGMDLVLVVCLRCTISVYRTIYLHCLNCNGCTVVNSTSAISPFGQVAD